ncbi:MAG: hypothetical protein AAGI30_11440 [Planctomycetota bacterium]
MSAHDWPAVLHRHTLLDSSWHYDLMLAPDAGPFDDDDRVLTTFRLAVEPWCGQAFDAEHIDPHRAAYLHLEARDLGARGRVELVARGAARWAFVDVPSAAKAIDVDGTLGGHAFQLRGTERTDRSWAFEPLS